MTINGFARVKKVLLQNVLNKRLNIATKECRMIYVQEAEIDVSMRGRKRFNASYNIHKLNGKKKKDNNNKKKKRRDEPKMAELKLSKVISIGVKHRFPRMIVFHRENLLHKSVIFPALGRRKMQNSIAEYFVQITTCV